MSRRVGGWRWPAFAVAVAVHLVVLYAPRAPAAPGPIWLDKAVHVAIFALVALAAAGTSLPPRAVLLALLGHAVLSELLQAAVLPARSGDPWDAVADAVGAVAAWALVERLNVRWVAPPDGGGGHG